MSCTGVVFSLVSNESGRPHGGRRFVSLILRASTRFEESDRSTHQTLVTQKFSEALRFSPMREFDTKTSALFHLINVKHV